MLACALHAGQRERDLQQAIETLVPIVMKKMAGG